MEVRAMFKDVGRISDLRMPKAQMGYEYTGHAVILQSSWHFP